MLQAFGISASIGRETIVSSRVADQPQRQIACKDCRVTAAMILSTGQRTTLRFADASHLFAKGNRVNITTPIS